MRKLGMRHLLDAKARSEKPDLHFATSKYISAGKFFFIEKTDTTPKYFICHPDEFETIEGGLRAMFTLIPLRYYKPSKEEVNAILDKLGRFFQLKTSEIMDDTTREALQKCRWTHR